MSDEHQFLHDCNGVEMPFPLALATEARQIYDEHVASNLDDAWDIEDGVGFSAPSKGYNFYYTNPPSNWGYRLQWVYADSGPTLARFEAMFQAAGVAEALNKLPQQQAWSTEGQAPILYGASFVVRCSGPAQARYHDDFGDASQRRAYTLMLPLQVMTENHCHLVWKDKIGCEGDSTGESHVYQYKAGTAILFGSGFIHATQPVHQEHDDTMPRAVFLCLNFGTPDCSKDWKSIFGSLLLGSPVFSTQRRIDLGVAEDRTKENNVLFTLEIGPEDVEVPPEDIMAQLGEALPAVDWQGFDLEPIGFGINLVLAHGRLWSEQVLEQDIITEAAMGLATVQSVKVVQWGMESPTETTFKT